LEEARSLAATSNFNAISAVYAELAVRDNIDVVRGQLLPQVSLVGTLSRTSDPSVTQKGDLTNQAHITAQLTMPLYEGGAISSTTAQKGGFGVRAPAPQSIRRRSSLSAEALCHKPPSAAPVCASRLRL
jgi:hypothetical protein